MRNLRTVHRGFGLALGLVLTLALAGCNTVGPQSISSAREAYNAAITETNERQLLRVVVQSRYAEFGSLLAVSSVTANMRVATSAAVNLGLGPDSGYQGNLVPFAAGVVYEENPTIQYTPVQGEKYIRQLLSPLPLDLLVLLVRFADQPDVLLTLILERFNHIRNPEFFDGERDPRFGQLVGILTRLTIDGNLEWVQNAESEGFSLIFWHRGEEEALTELCKLLGRPGPTPEDLAARDFTAIPVALAVQREDAASIAVTTRSVGDILDLMAAAVEVPAEDEASGRAKSYPNHLFSDRIRIKRSLDYPSDARVVVRYRDAWYYIEDTDLVTKEAFTLLQTLWTARIEDSGLATQSAPILTVPVSG